MSTATPQETTAGHEPMLEFKFPETEAGQVDARTLMRWCTHRPLLKPLEETGYKNPYLVIVVRSHREIYDGVYSDTEWEDTAVYAVKLTAEMHHVYFHRPGKNEIRAFVVDYDDKRTREWVREQVNMPRLRLSGAHHGFVEYPSLYTDVGTLRGRSVIPGDIQYFATDAVAEVDVPDGLFAPPPSGWRKNFVSRYYKGKPYDECDFRKQLIGSCLKAVFYATFGTLTRCGLILIALVFGLRGIQWKVLLRPLARDVDPVPNTNGSIWLEDKHGNDRLSPLLLINPIVLSIVPNALYGLSQIPQGVTKHGHHYKVPFVKTGYWQCVAWVDGSIVAFALAITAVVFLVLGILWLAATIADSSLFSSSKPAEFVSKKTAELEASRKKAKKLREAAVVEREKQARLDIQAAIAEMTCNIDSTQVSVAALPKKKQTVKLRASQAKVALCKPFAR